MLIKLNFDEILTRWKGVGLLENIDDISDQLVLSIFYEKMLHYLTFLSNIEKNRLPENHETALFPIVRRLFERYKLRPKYFLLDYEVENFESYTFFITLSREIDERNIYEKEVGDYVEKHLNHIHRNGLYDDLELSIKTFIPVLIINF